MLAHWFNGEWVYIGRVGTGFSDAMLRDLAKTLKPTEVKEPTANAMLMEAAVLRKAHWVKPTIVAEVFYQAIGTQGLLRHPALKTIRADKTPVDLQSRRRSRKATR